MRVATPYSLLMVSMVPADGDDVYALGPFDAVNCMDDKLTGTPHPDRDDTPDSTLAYYDPGAKRWFTPQGRPLILWSVQSVDDVLARPGVKAERGKADYIVREFPPEAGSVFAKD